MFEKRAPIDFMDRSGFPRSAAFLRVNKLVYSEARVFVYGGNRFCFGYNFAKSGNYFGTFILELIFPCGLAKMLLKQEDLCSSRTFLQLQPVRRISNADSGICAEREWKELGWTHVRRFLTDIGPENTSLIKDLGILFSDASQSNVPCTLLFRWSETFHFLRSETIS